MRAGALPESERAAVQQHFEGCQTCRVFFEANVSLPARRSMGLYSPLLLVAGLSLGAVVLARCGGPATPPSNPPSGGTDVAKAPGTEGADPANPAPGATQPPPQTAVVNAPHVATPPSKGPEAAALPGTPAEPRRFSDPQDPRMKSPDGQLKPGSGKTQEGVEQPADPKLQEAPAPKELPEVGRPSKAPVDPNAGATHPEAPTPPAPSGAGAPVLPPTDPSKSPVGPDINPTQPGAPKGPTSGERVEGGPSAPVSPGARKADPVAPRGPGKAPVAKDETVDSLKDRRILLDGSRSAGARAKAAERLGKSQAADAVSDLLEVAQSDVALRLRSAALEALAEIGDAGAVGGLQDLMVRIPFGDLELPSLTAGALRRLGAGGYLHQRAARDMADFAPRARARGALTAGGAEDLALAGTLIGLLADRAVVSADATHIAGRRLADGVEAVEVRHVAARALTLLSGGANYGLSAEEWRGWLEREIEKRGAAPVTPPAAPTGAPVEHRLAAELTTAAPELERVLESRDQGVIYAFVDLLQSHTDYARLATPPGDIYAPIAKKLGSFKSAGERDAALATFYVAVFDECGLRDPRTDDKPSTALAAALAGAGKAGRTAYVARLGAPGVQKLVAELERVAQRDPEAQYGAGGHLLRLLDAFRGTPPKRPFLDPAGKDADARVADNEAFRAAVAEYGTWWRGLGVPHWDRAGGRIVDGE